MTIDTPKTVEEFVGLWFWDETCSETFQEVFGD